MTVLEVLLKIDKAFSSGSSSIRQGICDAYDTEACESYFAPGSLIAEWRHHKYSWFRSWKDFSGSLGYPIRVPEAEFGHQMQFYLVSEGRQCDWVDDYLQKRRELLQHLIDCARTEEI